MRDHPEDEIRMPSEMHAGFKRPLSVRSAELLGRDRELLILHRGGVYRLYLTPDGRLVLRGPRPAVGPKGSSSQRDSM